MSVGHATVYLPTTEGNEMTLITTIGIRLGADEFFVGKTWAVGPEFDEVVTHAGQCCECGEFDTRGGYSEYCEVCV